MAEPEDWLISDDLLVPPLPPEEAREVRLQTTSSHDPLPPLDPLPDVLELSVMLAVGDDVSTDEIMPAGGRAMPFWSSIQRSSDFAFEVLDPTYVERVREVRGLGGHVILAGRNYGQGSSREQAAFAPRYLGLRVVIAQSFARIHWGNLVQCGVLPLTISDAAGQAVLAAGSRVRLAGLHELADGEPVTVTCLDTARTVRCEHGLSTRQIEIVVAGGLINYTRARLAQPSEAWR